MPIARLQKTLGESILSYPRWVLLLSLSAFGLLGCTEKTAISTRSNLPTDEFVIQGSKVINAAFFTGINTPQYSFMAGGDGSIIYSADSKSWQTANTSGISDNITSLSANSAGNALIATGENGLLAYSTNAGKDWQKITLPITQNLYASAYDSAHNTWVAVGANGVLLYSDAPAQTWRQVALHSTTKAPAIKMPAINAIQYSAQRKALIASGDEGALFTSTDGGESWTTITSNSNATLSAQIHLATAIIILGTDGCILRSDNDINQWQKIEINKDTLLISAAFDSTHKTISIIADNGDIYISDDNGKNWGFSYNAKQRLRSISYSEKHRSLIATGTNGTLIYSDNGGRVWNKSTANINSDFESLFNVSNGDIFALGAGGLIASSTDGGKNWTLEQESITSFIHQLAASPHGKKLIAVGASGLLLDSKDIGNTWRKTPSPLNSNDYLFSFITDKKTQTLIAAGSPGTIMRSLDNGQNWKIQLALGDANAGYFHKLVKDNQSTVVALAGPGTSYYSVDNGENWQAANINNEQHLFKGVYDTAHNRFVAVGNEGVIQVSANGKDWNIVDSGIKENLQGIYFFGKLLFATGSNGTLLRSSDGGEHWQKLQSDTTTAIQYLFAAAHINKNTSTHANTNTLIATGLSGLILRSTDAGDTWQTITNLDKDNLREPVQDKATGIIYISSRSGNILYSRDIGESWELMPRLTQHSIKGLYIDEPEKILIGYGERIIRMNLLK